MSSSSTETDSQSDSDSGSDVQDVQGASASQTGANLALSPTQLPDRSIRRSADSTQSQRSAPTEQQSSLQGQLTDVVRDYLHAHQPHRPASIAGSARSTASSMAVSIRTRTTSSSGATYSRSSTSSVPSLSTSGSTIASSASILTSKGAQLQPQYAINEDSESDDEDDEDEAVRLECCFGFLQCPGIFSDLETWDRHSRAHYRGNLPSIASCAFRECGWAKQAQPNVDIWDQRLRHMRQEHQGESYQYPRTGVSPAVAENLYRRGLISQAQYQELRRDGRLSDRPVLQTSSRRADRRQRRR